jgi:hypothetical protein
MPFVVDASVAVCWFTPDERHPTADASFHLMEFDSVFTSVPWWYELRNVLMVNERRGRLDNAKAAGVLRLLRGLPIAIDADVEEEMLMPLVGRERPVVEGGAPDLDGDHRDGRGPGHRWIQPVVAIRVG